MALHPDALTMTRHAALARLGQRGLDDVLAAVFPAACRSCGRALESDAGRVRGVARRFSHPVNGQLRRRLLGPISAPLVLLCAGCAGRLRAPSEPVLHLDHPADSTASMPCVSAFGPGPEIFALIHAFKYQRCLELGPWFGVHLAHAVRRARPYLDAADALVPVPLHPDRRRERGYDQCDLLALHLSRRLGTPVAAHVAARRRSTPAQATQALAARWTNLSGAFASTSNEPLRGSTWLLDDVVTSGATLHALGDALRARGARRLVALALCRARPDLPA